MAPVLVCDNPILALDAVGPSTPTVEHRCRGNAGVGENAPKSSTAVGERGQRRVPGTPDSVEAPIEQCLDVGLGFGDGAENLATTSLRFDIANPHLQMPLAILTATDEGRIQGRYDSLRLGFRRRRRGTLAECLADFQGMTPQGLRVPGGIERKHLPQQIGSFPVGHQG